MWIKSQNGELLINTNCIELRGKEIVSITQREGLQPFVQIGKFKTEEKAKLEFEYIEFAIREHQNFYEISEDTE